MHILSIGHRGAKGHYNDNTVKSILSAKILGADLIEVDVQLTKDNVFVLYHDNKVQPFMMEEEKEICDIYFNELLTEDICTLNKGLGYIQSGERCVPYLDLKIPESKEEDEQYIKDYGDKLVTFLMEDEFETILLASFNKFLIDYLRQHIFASYFLFGYIYDKGEKPTEEQLKADVDVYVFDWEDVDTEVKGLKFVYTVNEEDIIKEMIKGGVDGIVSDYPERVVSIR